jgi:hypothetical protein
MLEIDSRMDRWETSQPPIPPHDLIGYALIGYALVGYANFAPN